MKTTVNSAEAFLWSTAKWLGGIYGVLYSFSAEFLWTGVLLMAAWVCIACANVYATPIQGETDTREERANDFNKGMVLVILAAILFLAAAILLFGEVPNPSVTRKETLSLFLVSAAIHVLNALNHLADRDA